jgi:hypothetical protein
VKLTHLSVALCLMAGSAVALADELDDAFQSLKQAETEKNAAQVKKLAAETHALASKVISAPAPESEDEKEVWKSRLAYAKDIDLHTEYALFVTAIQSPAATTVELLSALEEQNPKSKYLDQAYGNYLVALNQTGAAAKIPAIAEKGLASFPDNEDLLLFLAENAMTRQQPDRAVTYATRLTTALNRHSKPENLSAADWERKKTAALGRGYWIAGVIHGERNQYALADKELRAALPLIKGSDAMLAPALFYLGVCNYQLGKMTNDKKRVLEAAGFSDQAAAIAGPYQQQAWKNAQLIKTDAGRMR